MDDLQNYFTSLYSLYSLHSSTLRAVASTVTRITFAFQTYVLPPIDRLFRTLAAKPDVASVVLLIVLLFVSLKLLNLLYQAVMFWVRLIFRVVFWSAIIGVVAWVVSRGPDGVVDDVQRLADAWRGEYQYWQAREREGWVGGGGAGGRGRGYGGGQQAYGRGRAGWR
ncbi:hypothetical protein K461DRAFT_293402 [Myriangium duriaei CBS 260.36]|uniref:Nuclear pore assembly and biogenesis-domain-containing protein n=1 Tax=Myriangium duriaei CBS 260.36 TaxID=1168546 RepID=A0A9P4J089_9PEZI|nr:hypothetical protein K461DRAFT_293402 [Myriangium duriaei CBS 260.36]